MDVGRHGCRAHTGLEIKLVSNYKLLLSPPHSVWSILPISFNAKTCFLFQALLLWCVMHACIACHNVHLLYPSKSTASSLWVSFWCELLMYCRHIQHMLHILYRKHRLASVLSGCVGDPWHKMAPFQCTSLNISHTRLRPVFIAYPLWGIGIQ